MTKTALLFPGQGTLPSDVATLSGTMARLYDRAAREGLPIERWIRDADATALRPTDAAQMAIFLDALAQAEALEAAGISPDVVAGHSLGEYAALVVAGVLDADTAFGLVLRRGRLMSSVRGGMVAVLKLEAERVAELCRSQSKVFVANRNLPLQTVVSGPLDALDSLAEAATREGGRAVRLAVAGPFHSPWMADAASRLEPFIDRARFASPTCEFISSVSGRKESDPETLRRLLKTQMTACVRWHDVVLSLLATSVTRAIEVGPGEVLTNLGRRATDLISFQPAEEVLRG
ncbi:MAG: ACP S-malonyltransferase [Candidatus Bipolaricaulota bacterium]